MYTHLIPDILLRFKGKGFRFFSLFLCLVIMAACNDDLPPEIEEPHNPGAEDNRPKSGNLSIGFRVAAPTGRSTRATADDGTVSENEALYDDGEELESTIDFTNGSYRIYFFDMQNKFIAEWVDTPSLHILAGDKYWLYTFEGKAPEKLTEYSDFRIMILANWPSYPNNPVNKTINDIIEHESATFNAFSRFDLSLAEKRLIPLYGLATFTGIVFEDDRYCELNDINLLRAVAKIEVNLESLPQDVELIGNPVIRGINPTGYCATKGPYGSGQDWNYDYISALHLPYGENTNYTHALDYYADMLEVTPEDDTSGKRRWIAYVPEFRNIGVNNYSRIELNLSHITEPFILNFANYDSDGRPNNDSGRFDIRRNDLYKFNVKGNLHEILFRLNVEEWIKGGQTEIEM